MDNEIDNTPLKSLLHQHLEALVRDTQQQFGMQRHSALCLATAAAVSMLSTTSGAAIAAAFATGLAEALESIVQQSAPAGTNVH